mmetsp:Transcript_42664/g.85619  ORF Transcript_42664/g.85619 Transcript_42664/m.85619 type:complete len:103 (-) Transcript_42664:1794-2102(-)
MNLRGSHHCAAEEYESRCGSAARTWPPLVRSPLICLDECALMMTLRPFRETKSPLLNGIREVAFPSRRGMPHSGLTPSLRDVSLPSSRLALLERSVVGLVGG